MRPDSRGALHSQQLAKLTDLQTLCKSLRTLQAILEKHQRRSSPDAAQLIGRFLDLLCWSQALPAHRASHRDPTPVTCWPTSMPNKSCLQQLVHGQSDLSSGYLSLCAHLDQYALRFHFCKLCKDPLYISLCEDTISTL